MEYTNFTGIQTMGIETTVGGNLCTNKVTVLGLLIDGVRNYYVTFYYNNDYNNCDEVWSFAHYNSFTKVKDVKEFLANTNVAQTIKAAITGVPFKGL